MTLDFQDVSVSFGEHRIINRLTTRLDFEHVLAFIGPSGGGKSTLLRLLGGLITPDSGSIRIDDQAIPRSESALRPFRARIGIVFQAYNLFPHLTALDNIVLPLVQVHGVPRSEAVNRAHAILDRFQLGPHAAKRPAELSGGQRQRVAIARAIAIEARLIILDEPTSALDPEMTGEVLDLITELRDDDRTLLIVSHEMGFVRRIADRVAFVDQGGITESAPGEDIFESPQNPATQRFLERVFRY